MATSLFEQRVWSATPGRVANLLGAIYAQSLTPFKALGSWQDLEFSSCDVFNGLVVTVIIDCSIYLSVVRLQPWRAMFSYLRKEVNFLSLLVEENGLKSFSIIFPPLFLKEQT